jgi:hypothetical protein
MSQMTREQIEQAEAAGILSRKQARAMLAELAAQDPDTARPKAKTDAPKIDAMIGNEDDLRFLRSFGDVFIGVGLIVLALGVAAITGMLGGGLAYLGAAAAAYAMAEYFGRAKRAHFPTLICALAFLVFVHNGLGALLPGSAVIAAAITVGAMALFYARIRLPFCIALIAVALIYLLFAVLGMIAPDLLRETVGTVLVLSGLAIFIVALLYDTRDTHRRTRFADNAFWLHLLAAPLIIHGLIGEAVMTRAESFFGVPIPQFTESDATIILIAMGVVTIIGLAINRRALIVSSLFYAGIAVGFLLRRTGLDLGGTLAVTLIVMGAMIVLLGVAWHPVRNQLIRILPKWKVFPPPFEAG